MEYYKIVKLLFLIIGFIFIIYEIINLKLINNEKYRIPIARFLYILLLLVVVRNIISIILFFCK